MTKQTENTTLVFDLSPLENLIKRELSSVHERLDKLQSSKETNPNDLEVEWITSKAFMNKVSIKSFTSFYTILDRMPENLKTKVGGKIYVHRDTIRMYFEGTFTDQK